MLPLKLCTWYFRNVFFVWATVGFKLVFIEIIVTLSLPKHYWLMIPAVYVVLQLDQNSSIKPLVDNLPIVERRFSLFQCTLWPLKETSNKHSALNMGQLSGEGAIRAYAMIKDNYLVARVFICIYNAFSILTSFCGKISTNTMYSMYSNETTNT